jgi:hypothetical protein
MIPYVTREAEAHPLGITSLHQVGFKRIVWHAMQVSAEGFATYGKAYWQAYLTHPPRTAVRSRRMRPSPAGCACSTWSS